MVLLFDRMLRGMKMAHPRRPSIMKMFRHILVKRMKTVASSPTFSANSCSLVLMTGVSQAKMHAQAVLFWPRVLYACDNHALDTLKCDAFSLNVDNRISGIVHASECDSPDASHYAGLELECRLDDDAERALRSHE